MAADNDRENMDRFVDEAMALQAQLHAAIVREDLDQVAARGTELEEYWSFAVAHGKRKGLRHVNGLFLASIDTALAFVNEELTSGTLQGWSQRWQVLAEAGTRILRADESGAVREEREALRRSKHADKVISLLDQNGIANHTEMKKALKIGREACNNHLRRLMERGLISRVARGLYRLTVQGSAVAKLLNQETTARHTGAPTDHRKAEQQYGNGFLARSGEQEPLQGLAA